MLGMKKIEQADQQIRDMQVELQLLGPKIENHSFKLQQLMQQLQTDKVAVEEVFFLYISIKLFFFFVLSLVKCMSKFSSIL